MGVKHSNRVYLDTETTGLKVDEGNEILTLSIVSESGIVLFDEAFKPKYKTEWPDAEKVNHISPKSCRNLDTIDCYLDEIKEILRGFATEVVGYNLKFDLNFLEAAGIRVPKRVARIDTMQEFITAFGKANPEKDYQKLIDAADRINYKWSANPHGSLPDTLACRAVQRCVDDHNWCWRNLPMDAPSIMQAKCITNGSFGRPAGCWDLNPGGRGFAVTESVLNRLKDAVRTCHEAGIDFGWRMPTPERWVETADAVKNCPDPVRAKEYAAAACELNKVLSEADRPSMVLGPAR